MMSPDEMLAAVRQELDRRGITTADLAKASKMSVAGMESYLQQNETRLLTVAQRVGVDVLALQPPAEQLSAEERAHVIDGQALADAIGLRFDEPPLVALLNSLGVKTAGGVASTINVARVDLRFENERLWSVSFMRGFSGTLPAGLSFRDPLPANFVAHPQQGNEKPGHHDLRLGGLTLSMLEDHGANFYFSVAADDPSALAALPSKPLSAALAAADASSSTPARVASSAPPGVPIGYKTSWLAVRSDDVRAIAEVLALRGSGSPCAAAKGLVEGAPFISAARDGWRLVLWSADDVETGLKAAERLSAELSTTAGFFASDRVIGLYVWSRFDDGQAARVRWIEDGEVRRAEGPLSADEPSPVDEIEVEELAAALCTAPVVPDAPGLLFE